MVYLNSRDSTEALDLLQACRDYFACIPESAAGGDDKAIKLARQVNAFLERMEAA